MLYWFISVILIIIWFFFSLGLYGERFYLGRVAANGETGLVFGNQRLMRLFRDTREVHMDATFAVVPHQFKQMATLLATYEGHVSN